MARFFLLVPTSQKLKLTPRSIVHYVRGIRAISGYSHRDIYVKLLLMEYTCTLMLGRLGKFKP